MSLHIDNPRTDGLARGVAALTGESLTVAVTIAVEERLWRVRGDNGKPLSEQLLETGKDAASHMREPYRSIDHVALLFQERGLPR